MANQADGLKNASPAEQSLEREALSALRSMRLELETLKRDRSESIAIVGMAFRFPGDADDPESYWELLKQKRDAIVEIPTERMDLTDIFDTDREKTGKTYSQSAGMLERVDEFDAGFFGIAAREAAQLDPQQRIFLECAWHALESAAIRPATLRGSMTGVFAGATTWEYAALRDRTMAVDQYDRYSVAGLALNAIAGRVSYVLGVHGPSLTIDTACSSSLVAIDRACRSLREGESSMALAGGVNVLATAESLVSASLSGMLSSRGVVGSFSSLADGFVRGEGCGVVVLRRLRDAEASGERILGVIRGSAVNHDGPTSGLTVPSGSAQQLLLRSALASAALAPASIGYVEAHGTGTRLGDPIEAEALGAVFAGKRDRPLAIGSVKTNLGHLEAAAGMAGLIKLLLALEHGEIPAQLHFDSPSELIRWNELPLEVVTEQRSWEPIAGRRIGGVSAFGFSGTNAHVIVEEAPARQRVKASEPAAREAEVLAISGKTEAALGRMVTRYRTYLELHPELSWEDVCHTAGVGRTHFQHRLAVVAGSVAEAAERLRAYEQGARGAGLEKNTELVRQAVEAPRELSADQLARAYMAGAEVDWTACDSGRARQRIRLPGYAFERQRHWFSEVGGGKFSGPSAGVATGHPLLGVQLRSAAAAAQFEQTIPAAGELAGDLAWLAEHRIGGRVLMPAAAFAEMLLAASDRMGGEGAAVLEEMVLSRPLELERGCLVQLVAEPAEARPGSFRVRVYSVADEPNAAWVLHAEGTVRRQKLTSAEAQVDLDAVRRRCPEAIEGESFYREMQERGADFGPRFRQMQRLWSSAEEALGEVRLEALGERLHPATLDACLQVAAALLPNAAVLPLSLSSLAFREGEMPQQALVYVTKTDANANPQRHANATSVPLTRFNLQIFDTDHTPITNIITIAFAPRPEQKEQEPLSILTKGWVRVEVPNAEPLNISSEPWVILADQGGTGTAITLQLAAAGANCTLISINAQQPAACVQTGERSFSIREIEAGPVALALQHHRAVPRVKIVHLWALNADALSDPAPASEASVPLLQAHKFGYGAALLIAKLYLEWKVALTLFVITRSAEPVGTPKISSVGAAAWAFRRVVSEEYPDIRTRAIDLPENAGQGDIASAVRAILGGHGEAELVIRGSESFVPRWTEFAETKGDLDHAASKELCVSPTGLLEDLHFVTATRTEPNASEVEIEVRATGLNFRDVLTALAILPANGKGLGGECAGVIARAGAKSGFNTGDEVFAFAAGSFRPFVTVSANDVVRKPAKVSFEEAACLPVSYLTALYALDRLARLRDGQSVLIHSATGGLGQATLQVARLRGAQVFATAGTEVKRELLCEQGVADPMDSRSTSFASDVRGRTGGRGVDVVLNTVSGVLLDEGLALVAEGGVFIELGKRGILSEEEARRRRPDVRYFVFDLGTEAEKDSHLVPSLLKVLCDELERGALHPLSVERFAMADAAQAFRKMSQAKHVGKLCLTRPGPGASVSPGATYLITGALGALGLHTVQWLSGRGARSFVLISRGPHVEAEEPLSRLRRSGVSIEVVYGDCGTREVINRAIAAVSASAPLRGIVHCAGVLRDAIIPKQTWEMFLEVASAKIAGAWNLHLSTRELPIDFFITFSSASATLQVGGQANYAAANAAMDSIALYRRRIGLQALTVNWGPWSDTGMAATGKLRREISAAGIRPQQAFEAIECLLNRGIEQAMILQGTFAARAVVIRSPEEQVTYQMDKLSSTYERRRESLFDVMRQKPLAVQRRLLNDAVARSVSEVLGSPDRMRYPEDTAFFDLGVDSLMAVELRNALMKTLGIDLSSTLAFDYPTFGVLLDHLQELAAGRDTQQAMGEDLSSLSEFEAETMLLAELQGGPIA